MPRIRRTLFNRTPKEWEALVGRIEPYQARFCILRICWFDYISEGEFPEYGVEALRADLGSWSPPPATIERELKRLGYPPNRAKRRAWYWARMDQRIAKQSQRPGDAEGSRGVRGKRA